MLGRIVGARTVVPHAEEHVPAPRVASVARHTISESGTFPLASGAAIASSSAVLGVDPYAEQAARILREALDSVGATQADLARALGVTHTMVGLYLKPDRPETPSLLKILRLCRAAPRIHTELLRRIAGACSDRGPASVDPGGDMALAVGVCGEFASTIARILAFGATAERIPEGRRAVAKARQVLDAVERALEAAERGSR